MKLDPEQLSIVAGRSQSHVSEYMADQVRDQIGREITDAEYDKLCLALDDALHEVLAGLEFADA